MSTTVVDPSLAVGSIVPLVVAWGSQRRLRCPACQRFMAQSSGHQCRCGAVYAQIEDTDDFVVEALP
jgi:hypothetical protein